MSPMTTIQAFTLPSGIAPVDTQIEKAQQIANHESPRTTKLYDRTTDQVSLDEIERIAI